MTQSGNIYLTGFMGAGKTTAGKLLAKKTGLGFVDLDEFIVRQTGQAIPEIFKQTGEKGFRELETETLKSLKGKQAVVSTGGGAVETPDNLIFMKESGYTVFLDAPFEVLYERIRLDPNRPLVSLDQAELEKRYEKRREAYETADLTIQTKGLSPREIVRIAADGYYSR
ncbi:shikimate kinase [Alteribacter natronophilus]|uniref:shikimate kinase n=1 Tax=Alteribacter natronophilus TaxID=2583810 RepID=UPI00110F1018|nr:shikimate kinase [Alteribacter natronophilus]TMW73776.1 shikimate kinase [Alteribacter natronophilus]